MIHIHVVWRVYLWCVFFISRISLCALSDCSSWCSHLVCLFVLVCVRVFSFPLLLSFAAFLISYIYMCIITIHQLRGTTVFHVILLYKCYISLLLSSLFSLAHFCCVLLFFALASNISYLIILMCLIVCLKVFHPLSTGAGARAYIQYKHTHRLKVIVRFTSFFSELKRLFLTMPRRKLYIFSVSFVG